MRRPVKPKAREGMEALAEARQGRRTLRTHAVNPDFAKQVEIAERVMREDRDALRKLAE